MTNSAPVPYQLAERGPRRPTCAIVYCDSGEPIYRNIHRNRHGEPELILEAADARTIRIDVDARLEPGEMVYAAQCNPQGCMADAEYTGTQVLLTVWASRMPRDRRDCSGHVWLQITTSTGETLTMRIAVKLVNRENGPLVTSFPPFSRGSV